MATHSNQLWVTDMTYVPTWAGLLYLTIVTDVYNRILFLIHEDDNTSITADEERHVAFSQ